eukprot:gene3957-4944_t
MNLLNLFNIPIEWKKETECTNFEYVNRVYHKCIKFGLIKDCESHREAFEDLQSFVRFYWPLISDQGMLEWIGEFTVWSFFTDDFLEVKPFDKSRFDSQLSIWLKGELPEKPNRLDHWTFELRKRTKEICKRPDMFNRLITTIYSSLIAAIPYYGTKEFNIHTFLVLRILASGVQPCNSINEIVSIKTLDSSIFYDPIYRKMEDNQCLIICLVNDLFSYEKELKAGQIENNSIHILQNQDQSSKNPTFTEAIQMVIEMIKRYVQEYKEYEKLFLATHLHTLHYRQREELMTVVNNIRYSISGNLIYSANCKRYSLSPEMSNLFNDLLKN